MKKITLLCMLLVASLAFSQEDCAGVVDLGALTSPYDGDTTGAVNDFGQDCLTNVDAPDQIFSILVPAGQQLVIGQSANSYDSKHRLAYGACPGDVSIACTDDPDDQTESWTNDTGADQTVYWTQSAFSTGSGAFTLEWVVQTPPSGPENDDLADATPITCGNVYAGDTSAATIDEADAPDVATVEADTGADTDSPNVWFSFTGTGDIVTLSTCVNTDFDTEIFVFTGTSGALTCIDDGFDECGGADVNFTAETSFTSVLGTEYLISVEGWNVGSVGAFELAITCEAPPECTSAVVGDLGALDDCAANNEYSIIVPFTSEGDATGVFDGTTTYPIIDGEALAGPYASGQVVTLDIVHSDPACDFSFEDIFFACPLPQDACDTADTIGPGTYTTTISQGSGGSEMGTGGDSAFFIYTPTEDGEIYVNSCDGGADTFLNIGNGVCGDLTSIASNDDSCASGLGNNFASELTIPVTAGTTYYIEWDDRYASGANEFIWTLEFIEGPVCIPATIDSSAVVETCNPDGTGTFTVVIEVTDAGDAGSVFSDGTDTFPVVAGSVSTGTYNSGESVTIELIALDEDCSSTVGTFEFTCPPPAPENDDASDAFNLPVGDTACETIVSGTNVGATTSVENDTEASCSSSDPSGDVWFKVMVPVTGELTIEITSSDVDPIITDTVMEVYTGTSGALTEIACSDDIGGGNLLSRVELTGLTPGEVLLVRVWEWQDNFKGNFNICAWSPTTLGVDDNTFNGFTYYPNPVKDVLSLESPRAIDSVEVFNVLGQRIVALDSQNTIQNVDMSNLQSGMYLVKVSIGTQTKTIRVLKE